MTASELEAKLAEITTERDALLEADRLNRGLLADALEVDFEDWESLFILVKGDAAQQPALARTLGMSVECSSWNNLLKEVQRRSEALQAIEAERDKARAESHAALAQALGRPVDTDSQALEAWHDVLDRASKVRDYVEMNDAMQTELEELQARVNKMRRIPAKVAESWYAVALIDAGGEERATVHIEVPPGERWDDTIRSEAAAYVLKHRLALRLPLWAAAVPCNTNLCTLGTRLTNTRLILVTPAPASSAAG